MAPISDFNMNLVDGGLEFSTTDTNFFYTTGSSSSDYFVSIIFKNIPYTSFTNDVTYFYEDGTGSVQFDPSFNNVPVNIEIIINDDDNPTLSSLNDSVFYYNITSTSNDIFDTTNVLSEGKYIDLTATDRAVFSIDESTLSIENINGENFLNFSGKIENYQILVDAYGPLTNF